MPDETNPNPIGEARPIEPQKGRALLKRFAAVVGVALGGAMAFVVLVAPTAVRGATRSAKLRWQQREKEIQEAVAAVPSAKTDAVPSVSKSQPPGAVSR